jgi:hypothetical protein
LVRRARERSVFFHSQANRLASGQTQGQTDRRGLRRRSGFRRRDAPRQPECRCLAPSMIHRAYRRQAMSSTPIGVLAVSPRLARRGRHGGGGPTLGTGPTPERSTLKGLRLSAQGWPAEAVKAKAGLPWVRDRPRPFYPEGVAAHTKPYNCRNPVGVPRNDGTHSPR